MYRITNSKSSRNTTKMKMKKNTTKVGPRDSTAAEDGSTPRWASVGFGRGWATPTIRNRDVIIALVSVLIQRFANIPVLLFSCQLFRSVGTSNFGFRIRLYLYQVYPIRVIWGSLAVCCVNPTLLPCFVLFFIVISSYTPHENNTRFKVSPSISSNFQSQILNQ